MAAGKAPWERGYIQVYTGDGKGKTTAALGLALRAAGACVKVFIAQFLKSTESAELAALERFAELMTVKQYGRGHFIVGEPEEEDIQAARAGLAEVRQIIAGGEYPLVILDEANVAVHFGLFSADELLDIVKARPDHVEVVITGRRADQRIIDAADLVTEMREVKHYHAAGVQARRGIDK